MRTDEQLLLIECKWGQVTRSFSGRPTPAQKARQHAQRFEQVLDRVLPDMGVPLRRSYLMVHLGHEVDAGVGEALAASTPSVTALEPKQLRAHVSRLASGAD
ncbi:MAG: hypothetical protein ACXVYW_14955 [Oryzihumus sp.]